MDRQFGYLYGPWRWWCSEEVGNIMVVGKLVPEVVGKLEPEAVDKLVASVDKAEVWLERLRHTVALLWWAQEL